MEHENGCHQADYENHNLNKGQNIVGFNLLLAKKKHIVGRCKRHHQCKEQYLDEISVRDHFQLF